jgi:hypothetical protein
MARIRDIPLPHVLDFGQAQRLRFEEFDRIILDDDIDWRWVEDTESGHVLQRAPRSGRPAGATRLHPAKSLRRQFGAHDQYAVDDLDAFLAKLRHDAKPVGSPSANMGNIPGAARQACCSAADIVRMILEKKLAWVGVLRGVRGYLSVLVKIDEVKSAVRGPDQPG